MKNLIKSGRLFLFLGAILFFIDSIIITAGLGGTFTAQRYGFYQGLEVMLLSVIMFVLAVFSKKHIAVDIIFLGLTCLAFYIIATVATFYEKSEFRPIALTVGIMCYIQGALSVLGGVLAIVYITKGHAASESDSYRSGGGVAALRGFGEKSARQSAGSLRQSAEESAACLHVKRNLPPITVF